MGKCKETNRDQADTRLIEQINASNSKEAKGSNRHVRTFAVSWLLDAKTDYCLEYLDTDSWNVTF
jgi:hypothetical protein